MENLSISRLLSENGTVHLNFEVMTEKLPKIALNLHCDYNDGEVGLYAPFDMTQPHQILFITP